MSTFTGYIREYPMLYIDNFPTQPKDCNSPKIFLLSHSHADHLNGLDQLYNSQCYASQVTIDILTLKYPLKYKNVNFIPLEFETETEIIGIDQGVSVTVAVTMIDANHCAGSGMFLIKGNKGSVLYTGDCRLERDTISRLNSDDILSIKALYIDTTKFQEQFLHIPTKQRSIDALINFIESQDKNDDTTQYILTKPWDFGSEDILIGLSKHFNTKIKVSQKRFNVYNFLEDLKDHFTVGNSRFHFGKYHKIHHQKFRVIHWIPYSFWNSEWEDSEDPSYCVDFLDKVIPENIPENSNGDCIVLNYSMHSSAQEIMDTVNLFDKDCQVHFCVVDQKEKTCEKMSWLLEKMDLRRSIKSLKRSYSNASTVLIERSHSIESLDLLRDFD